MNDIENGILAAVRIGGGYFNTDALTYPQDAMVLGSKNVFVVDNNAQKIFKGLTANGTDGRK
jgi:hypothetical protein